MVNLYRKKKMITKESFTLPNGNKIPKLGLGTWLIEDELVEKAVCDAIQMGYRHIDTAQAYRNEKGVGRGIKACGIHRNELFITTKLAAEIKDYQKAKDAIDQSLKDLDLDFIDLMLIHSPKPWREFKGDNHYFEGNRAAWKALEEAYQAGKVRAIGISNFEKVDIDNILSDCKIAPMVNQILIHAGNTPQELIDYCISKNILVEAYSPIAHGAALQNPTIIEMAKKYNVSIAQLCIRYTLQLGTLPLPKTANKEHMKDNLGVQFVIKDEDMTILKNMPKIEDYGEHSYFPVFGGKKKAK